MNKIYLSFWVLLLTSGAARAIDLAGMQEIGAVTGLRRDERGVTLTCADRSEVRLSVLAPDLVRVRVAFGGPLPERDHSWAIAKTDWPAARWELREEADAVRLLTAEVEVRVRRSPLLIEFREAGSGRLISADQRPMMRHPAKGSVAAARRMGFAEYFYGLGEKAARLEKRRLAFTNWNSDTPGYVEGTDPIYQSVPFYIGLERGAAYGIFFDNSYRSYFDFGKSTQQYTAFAADGGEMNYYFFHGPSMRKVIERYTELTGRMPMPPRWALGNQQSRWSYYPESMAEEVVSEYRRRDLPLDVLYLDIDYMQGYRVFTWDTTRFPDPSAFTERLRRQGVKVVTIVDPGVKHQPPPDRVPPAGERPELAPAGRSYYVFNQGMEKNFFHRRSNGRLYVGRVWPGDSVFVDYTLPEARRWWGDLHRAYTDHGVAGIWTDMNEPADFIDQTGRAQMDVVSYDEGANTTHAKNRNVFALLMARATYEGLERLRPNERPFVITRAGFAGIQRYSTMWTGDNNSTWDALALSVPMFQSLGLSGQPFVGGDVGGFIGRSNGEMLARWYQVGFLTPFLRNHKVIDGYDHEPWRFGKPVESIIRKYLKLRYRLLPFLYTELEEAHRTGMPIFRPLILNFQGDESAVNIDDQFMIGEALMAAPVMKPDLTARYVYLPAGLWYDFWTGRAVEGGQLIRAEAPLDTVPLYVRGGAALVMGPEMSWVGEKPVDPLTFTFYPDTAGSALAALYEDDGTSPAYKRGVVRRTRARLTKAGDEYRIEVAAPEGTYDPGARQFIFVIRTLAAARQVTVDGRPLGPGRAGEAGEGWYATPEGIAVRLNDEGRARLITVR